MRQKSLLISHENNYKNIDCVAFAFAYGYNEIVKGAINNMKKILLLFVAATLFVFTSCSESMTVVDVKQTLGYSDYNTSPNKLYLCDEPLETSENARIFYLENKRTVDNFVITDFLDGVCINEILTKNNDNSTIEIPSKIGNKPVLKIGCSYNANNGEFDADKDILPALNLNDEQAESNFTVKINGNIKYISKYAFNFLTEPSEFSPVNIVVSENNEYYSSENGCLYDKNKNKLFYIPFCAIEKFSFTVPKSVTSFEPSNGLINAPYKLYIGSKVSNISASIYQSDSEEFYPINSDEDTEVEFSIYGKKGSLAEKWAKNNNINFIVK